MLAISRGPAGAADWRGTLLARQLLWLIAPLSFLLLLWDVQGRHRKVSASQLLSLAPPRRGSTHRSRGLGTWRGCFSRTNPGPRCRRRLGPARAPAPLPSSAAESPDVGFHPCAWSFISIKGQRSAGPRLRPPPPPAALPRGARRPGPTRARAAPAGARPEESRRGGDGGRLRAVLRGGGRGGERGWGGGRGAGTPLAAAGAFASLRSSDAGAAGLACCRGSRAGGAR